MVTSSARVHPRLVEAVLRIDDGRMPVAEVCRRLGADAEARGLTRPSYETVRKLVHVARAWKTERRSHGFVPDDVVRMSGYWKAFDDALRLLTGRW